MYRRRRIEQVERSLVSSGRRWISTETFDIRRSSVIKDCIVAISGNSLSSWPCCQAVLTALQSFWATDQQKSLEEVTRDLGLELGLF
jgi:hypothetical protein